MEQLLAFFAPIIEAYGGQYGVLVQILSILGTLRLVIKPVMALIEVYVLITPSKDDDQLPQKIEASKAYKTIVFLLDWFASIKLKK